MIMWAMSDRAIPRSLRMIEGFGVHSFRFVNAGEVDVRQVSLAAALGLQSTCWDEAVKIAGATRTSIAATCGGDRRRQSSRVGLGVQIFRRGFAATQPYRRARCDEAHSGGGHSRRIIGRMTLNRNVDNFFAETEQVAFMPSNIIPASISATIPCCRAPVLVSRHAEIATGTSNFHQIPINARAVRSTICSATG
jgi:catalase